MLLRYILIITFKFVIALICFTGQAELLKKERFTQFSGLIDNCEFKTGEKPITLEDLQGFWDIVYYQVHLILLVLKFFLKFLQYLIF